jgi:NAD(P)-dependent dehydrogenase (short-subunit alcohol dehydrogenase family)
MIIEGSAAVVTGGGSGLGAATVRVLAGAGAAVAILDRDAAAAQAVADQTGALALACDITDPAAVEAALATAEARNGGARILVNCAGVATGARIIARDGSAMPLDDFRRVVEINLVGSVNVLRLMAARAALLEPLAGGERGVIVNTASVAAFDGQIGQLAYAASKGGIAALTLPAARELARFGIRVCTIAPGLFETPMLLGLPAEVQASLGGTVPFPSRLGQPAEYAALVRHIVENPMLNGETIRLDGALRMAPR